MVHQRIGRSDHHLIMPGDSKEHASVGCLGDHHRTIAIQERSVEYQVYSLAGADGRTLARFIHLQDLIGKHTCRINNGTGLNRIDRSGFLIAHLHTRYLPFFFQQGDHIHIIQNTGSGVDSRTNQVDRQPRIIELSVMIEHPGCHPLTAKHRYRADSPLRPDADRAS